MTWSGLKRTCSRTESYRSHIARHADSRRCRCASCNGAHERPTATQYRRRCCAPPSPVEMIPTGSSSNSPSSAIRHSYRAILLHGTRTGSGFLKLLNGSVSVDRPTPREPDQHLPFDLEGCGWIEQGLARFRPGLVRLTGKEALDIPGKFCVDRPIELFLSDDESVRNLGQGVVRASVVLVMLLTVLHVPRLHRHLALCANCQDLKSRVNYFKELAPKGCPVPSSFQREGTVPSYSVGGARRTS